MRKATKLRTMTNILVTSIIYFGILSTLLGYARNHYVKKFEGYEVSNMRVTEVIKYRYVLSNSHLYDPKNKYIVVLSNIDNTTCGFNNHYYISFDDIPETYKFHIGDKIEYSYKNCNESTIIYTDIYNSIEDFTTYYKTCNGLIYIQILLVILTTGFTMVLENSVKRD